MDHDTACDYALQYEVQQHVFLLNWKQAKMTIDLNNITRFVSCNQSFIIYYTSNQDTLRLISLRYHVM